MEMGPATRYTLLRNTASIMKFDGFNSNLNVRHFKTSLFYKLANHKDVLYVNVRTKTSLTTNYAQAVLQ